MGFHNGAYATVWAVEPVSDIQTRARVSISRKDKNSGSYVNDFSGYINFFGTNVASKAARLREKDRIRLIETDAQTRYVEEKNRTYFNFSVFSFEKVDPIRTERYSTQGSVTEGEPSGATEGENPVESDDDSSLPF